MMVGLKHALMITIIGVLCFNGCGDEEASESNMIKPFTVAYAVGPGNTSGTVPVDGYSYNKNDSATVLGNTGNLLGSEIRDGIKQRFARWNTRPDGSGTSYSPGDTFLIQDNVTLYAIYTSGSDVLGKVGPAGGWIFYDHGSVASWGRYLESSRTDIFNYPPDDMRWGQKGIDENGEVGVPELTGIGDGIANSQFIYDAYGPTGSINPDRNYYYPAFFACFDYNGGSYNDWFLPSIDELELMYENLNVTEIDDFNCRSYWSSSEYNSDYAWYYTFIFPMGNSTFGDKHLTGLCVRPVRAF